MAAGKGGSQVMMARIFRILNHVPRLVTIWLVFHRESKTIRGMGLLSVNLFHRSSGAAVEFCYRVQKYHVRLSLRVLY